jgi:dephospho-CoA kinase
MAAAATAWHAAGVTFMVGLSGGIGSGKSSVARLLAALGARVIDADAIVHELQAPGSPMLAEIAAAFGPGVIGPDGALERAALGAIVFRDAAARARLGAIVHPGVGAEIARRVARARSDGVELLVLDIPLLFEGRKAGTGSAARLEFDATVVVWAPEELQIARQMARDGCTRELALERVRAQLPLHEKKALADFVIDNSGTPEETERQVNALWETLKRKAANAARP